ncbi:ISL3 family transposase, partial [Marinilabiliaceae bacterium JC017]
MFTKELFEQALGIQSPWYVTSVDFNLEAQCLDVYIDFIRGSKFEYAQDEETTISTAYDTVD